MLNPIKALRDGGAWLADHAGKAAAKFPYPKNMSAKTKAKIAGVAGTVVGFGVFFAAAEVALPSLLLGGLFACWGVFPTLTMYLLGTGTAAAATATVGAGMIYGADKHCGIMTKVANAGDRLFDRIENAFTRTRAPSVTTGAAIPEQGAVSTFDANATVQPEFTKAVENAPAAPQPAPQLRVAPPRPGM